MFGSHNSMQVILVGWQLLCFFTDLRKMLRRMIIASLSIYSGTKDLQYGELLSTRIYGTFWLT